MENSAVIPLLKSGVFPLCLLHSCEIKLFIEGRAVIAAEPLGERVEAAHEETTKRRGRSMIKDYLRKSDIR